MSVLGLLKAVPWIVAAAGAGAGLWYRGELKDCQASVALEAAKAAESVRVQQERDSKFTRSLEETLRPIVQAVQEQGQATQMVLAKVKSDPNCGGTPAARAFDRIVDPQAPTKTGAKSRN